MKQTNTKETLKEKNFIYHFRNYFSGNLITKILSLITLPIITKLLSPEDYGFYAIFMAYVSFAAVLITLNLSSSIGRYWYDDINIKTYIGTTLTAVVFATITLSFPAYYILYNYFDFDLSLYLILIIYVLFLTIASLFQQVYVSLRKSKLISLLDIIKSIVLFGITLLFIIYGDKKFSLINAGLVVGIAMSVLHLYYLRKYLSFTLNILYFKQNINYSLPLIFYSLSSLIFVNVDVDLYISTIQLLDFIKPLMRPGMIIYWDDWWELNPRIRNMFYFPIPNALA